ncbi:hypothetical protein E2C01_053594 [Portunus trituberculatus]|uniref:Uncharacterized protein n=1 Tax=Portunus trituberculatus TaxID=210409 RepID=A0A5B7GHJ9_PORTR|nr:hypothetical protein [Portunus trituberculatus]
MGSGLRASRRGGRVGGGGGVGAMALGRRPGSLPDSPARAPPPSSRGVRAGVWGRGWLCPECLQLCEAPGRWWW